VPEEARVVQKIDVREDAPREVIDQELRAVRLPPARTQPEDRSGGAGPDAAAQEEQADVLACREGIGSQARRTTSELVRPVMIPCAHAVLRAGAVRWRRVEGRLYTRRAVEHGGFLWRWGTCRASRA
jgi:hypothetical protein